MLVDNISMHLAACVAGGIFALCASVRAFAWAGEDAQLSQDSGALTWCVAMVAGAAVAIACAIARDAREALGVGVLLAGLAYLALVDWRTMLIPLWPAIGLIGAGIAFRAAQGVWIDSLLGVAMAGGGFWILSTVYQATRGRAGLGEGDALIAASLGAWLLPSSVAWAVVIGGLTTLAAVLSGQKLGWRKQDAPAPFAPGLAFGAYIAVLFWGM